MGILDGTITAEVTIRAVVDIPVRRYRLLKQGDAHEHKIMTLDLKHRLNAHEAEVQELFNTAPEEVTPVPQPEPSRRRRKKGGEG